MLNLTALVLCQRAIHSARSLIKSETRKAKMKNQKRIDFLGIGAHKSGTSWLYRNLMQIQEFSLPQIKEIHYFDRSRDYLSPNELSETQLKTRIWQKNYIPHAIRKILVSAIRQDWKLSRFYMNWFFSNYSDQWYLSLFKDFEGYTGEITPSYSILNEEDIRRIYRLLPDVRLVLMLRNPIERAWSHYRVGTKKIDNFNFDNVPDDDVIKFMESEGQSLRSDYIRTIDNFTKVFPKEQILIGFYDAVADNPTMLIKDILKHICGDVPISINHLDLQRVFNKSRKIGRPKEIDDYLKNRYHDQIKELSERYGGYFTQWYQESYTEQSINENTILMPTMYLKS